MADLTQSSSTVATSAPSYYTKYLTDLATEGGTAATNAAANVTSPTSAWDPTALQSDAFTNVNTNVGNYLPGLTTAGKTFEAAGDTDVTGAAKTFLDAGTTTSGLTKANPYLIAGTGSSADLVGGYMNPYTTGVLDKIRLANEQNIQQNLSPGITAGAVGGGQFGSQRGANALALGISNANIGALGKQAEALQSGYAQALTAAQKQRENQLQAGNTAGTLQNQFNTNQVTAGQVAGNMAAQEGQLQRDVGSAQAALANQTQTQGLADVNALSTLGAQQQVINQAKVMAPLDILSKKASLMSGAQLPMTTTSTMTGSPLSAIAGLGSLAVGMFTKNASGSAPWDSLSDAAKSLYAKMGITPEAVKAYTDQSQDEVTSGGAWTTDASGNMSWTPGASNAGGGSNMTSTGFVDASGNALIPDGSGGFTDTNGNTYDSTGTLLEYGS